jgi:hypothetical protein
VNGPALIQSDATRIPLADGSVDLVFSSPPYTDARTYGIGAQRKCSEWVEWMLTVVEEMTRVCSGLVLVNCAGVTRERNYWPACEGLMWEWWRRGGNLWRPAYWHRVGIPGSGGTQWLRADIEYVIPFKRDREWLPWSDNTANGHPPKWAPGGEMSYRLSSGARVNQWGRVGGPGGMGAKNADGSLKTTTRPSHKLTSLAGAVWGGGGTSFGRTADGKKIAPSKGKPFQPGVNGGHRADGAAKPRYFNGKSRLQRGNGASLPVLANPGNLIKGIKVGGGMLGSKLAHENEAPFPQKLAEWFIRGWCKPGGIVLDPFSGSGTTVAAAFALGRRGIGMDLRWSQCELGRRRNMHAQAPLPGMEGAAA